MRIFKRRPKSHLHPSLGGPRLRSSASGRRGRGGPRSSFVFGVVVVVLLLVLLFARMSAGGLLWRGLHPFNSVGNFLVQDTSFLLLPFNSKEELLLQNNTLRTELTQVKADAADRELLAKQNVQLQEALGRSNPTVKKIFAFVTARPPQLPYDVLMLDVGLHAGVALGDIISQGSTALGIVSEVGPMHARAALFSSPGTVTHVLVAGTLPIDLIGDGGGTFSTQVPQQTAIQLGDTAAISGVMGGVVATVVSIKGEPGKAYETIQFAAPISIFELPNVEISEQKLPAIDTATSTSLHP